MRHVVERLLAKVVASGQQSLATTVPKQESKHPSKISHRLWAPLLVEMNDHLGVGPRGESMAVGLKVGPESLEVVDLAVQNDGDGLVLVVDRLSTGDEVDDAEPAMAEGAATVRGHVEARSVRAAMGDRVGHRAERYQV
jgi:hypothetical protein